MYRIYDRPEAIRSVQRYLRLAGNPDIFIHPSGVYDENTRLSVIDFQERMNFAPTGVVDYETFDRLFSEYTFIADKNALNEGIDSFIDFPLLLGDMNEAMMHLNRSMRRLLDYYGFTHRLRDSNFYSKETSEAVRLLRSVYFLDDADLIDEEFYIRMVKDHDSIGRFNNNFR